MLIEAVPFLCITTAYRFPTGEAVLANIPPLSLLQKYLALPHLGSLLSRRVSGYFIFNQVVDQSICIRTCPNNMPPTGDSKQACQGWG